MKSHNNLPAYIVNIPIKVDSETDTTTDGETADCFPQEYFDLPERYIRLLPVKELERLAKTKVRSSDRIILVEETSDYSDSEPCDKTQDIIELFSKQAFGKNEEESIKESAKRLTIIFGYNKMRSMSQSRNNLLRYFEENEASFQVDKMAFMWEGIWQKRGIREETWSTVDYAYIKKFYRALKKNKGKEKAKEFRKKIEKDRSHLVPYREIRETIKNDDVTKQAIANARKVVKNRPVYLGFFDSDLKSLRLKTGKNGTFSVYDDLIKKNPGLVIASTGYSIKDPENPMLEFAVKCDMLVRHFTARFVKRGVYYPEPSTIVAVLPEKDTVTESFLLDAAAYYKYSNESRVLINNVIAGRGINPQDTMAFDRSGSVRTAVPARMKRNFQAREKKDKKIIGWRLSDLKTLKDVNQTHFHPKSWADNILQAFVIPSTVTLFDVTLEKKSSIKNLLVSLISSLFRVYDPIAIADNSSREHNEGFQRCFIRILKDYHNQDFKITPCVQEKKENENNKDFDKIMAEIKKITVPKDVVSIIEKILGSNNHVSVELIDSAAKASHLTIVKLFNFYFCLNFKELSINLMSNVISESLGENYAYEKNVLTKLILEDNLLDKKNLAAKLLREMPQAGVGEFKLTPLHWAFITGNKEIVKWLLSKRQSVKLANESPVPLLFCALKYCASNGNDLELLKLLSLHEIDLNLPMGKSNKTPITMAISEFEEPLPVVELLVENGARCIGADFWAAMENLEDPLPMVVLLCENELDLDIVDSNGDTPLLVAIQKLKAPLPLIKYLFEWEGEEEKINTRGYMKNYPLHAAIARDESGIFDSELLNYLLEHKPDLKVRNDLYQTPFKLAVELGNDEIIERLLQVDPNPNTEDLTIEQRIYLHQEHNVDAKRYAKKNLTEVIRGSGLMEEFGGCGIDQVDEAIADDILEMPGVKEACYGQLFRYPIDDEETSQSNEEHEEETEEDEENIEQEESGEYEEHEEEYEEEATGYSADEEDNSQLAESNIEEDDLNDQAEEKEEASPRSSSSSFFGKRQHEPVAEQDKFLLNEQQKRLKKA